MSHASSAPGRPVCVRCHRDLTGDARAPLSYREGPARRWVCQDCLSWAEKDAFLSTGPPSGEPAEREGRFTTRAPALG